VITKLELLKAIKTCDITSPGAQSIAGDTAIITCFLSVLKADVSHPYHSFGGFNNLCKLYLIANPASAGFFILLWL